MASNTDVHLFISNGVESVVLGRVYLVSTWQVLHIGHEAVQLCRYKRLAPNHLVNVLRHGVVFVLFLPCTLPSFDEIRTATALTARML